MNLDDLKLVNLNRKQRKRVGRGAGSGHGKTCCRGFNGAKSRSGSEFGTLFEGGQMPLFRRLPKRGFNNIFKKEYNIINVKDLDVFEVNGVIDIDILKEKGIVKKDKDGLKVLGEGEIKKSLKIVAHKFSKSAVKKIKDAGGETSAI
ncbi:MAG: 50S ribosomal protein L15 [Candidatus Anammoxibacter sp.]